MSMDQNSLTIPPIMTIYRCYHFFATPFAKLLSVLSVNVLSVTALWVCVFIALFSHCHASQANTLSPERPTFCLENWQILSQPHPPIDSEDAALLTHLSNNDASWSSANPQHLIGFKQDIWLRTSITLATHNDYQGFLRIDNTSLDQIDAYWIVNEKLVTEAQSGRLLPFSARPIDHRQFIIPFALKAQSRAWLYLHIKTLGPIAFRGCLETQESLPGFMVRDSLIYGTAFGLLALIFVYAGMTYYFERSAAYAILALGAIATFFSQLSQSGLGYQFLWPGSPHWNQISTLSFAPLVLCALIFFTIHFLELRQRMPVAYKILCVLAALSLLVWPLLYLVKHELIPVQTMLISIPIALATFITRTYAGFYLWIKKKLKIARFFVAAQTVTVVLATLYIFSRLGVLEQGFIKPWYLVYAGILPLLLLVVAITDRVKYIQKALENSYDNLDRLIESMPSMVLLCDHKLEIRRVNQYLLNELNYSRTELIGQHLSILFSGLAHKKQLTKQLSQLESTNIEYDYKRKDHSDYPVLLSHTLFYQQGEPRPQRLCVAQSLLALRKIEQERGVIQKQLMQSQRLEVIATTVSGMAHDLKNIFTPIIGFSELLLNENSLSQKQKKMLSTIFKSSVQGSALIKQALTIGQNKDNEQLKPISPYQVVKSYLDLIQPTLPTHICLETHLNLAPDINIVADKNQLIQVLMNLCQNAQHAMEDQAQGTLTITLSHLNIVDENSHTFTHLPLGDYVCLVVKDTGCGIDPKLKDKIFEPFYTSKESGKGTGLGLPIVYNAVYRSLGHIHVDSALGQGTSFKLYFPTHKPKTSSDNQTLPSLTAHGKHILYVDDDGAINFLMQHSLSKFGYRVTTTQKSLTALNYMQANPENFDLIISDHSMPDMSGLDLIHEIKKLRPEIPVLFVTGQEFLLSRREMDELGVFDHLSKPVLINDLVAMVRKAIASNTHRTSTLSTHSEA